MSINKKILPLGDRVLIKPIREDKKTNSGIIIPDSVSKEKPEKGKVIAVGAGRWNGEDNRRIPVSVKVGETVIFSKYSPDEIKLNDEEYFILREENILAIIK